MGPIKGTWLSLEQKVDILSMTEQAKEKGELLSMDWDDYRDDAVVYIPGGLRGYDLKLIRNLARHWFKGDVDGEAQVLVEACCKSMETVA